MRVEDFSLFMDSRVTTTTLNLRREEIRLLRPPQENTLSFKPMRVENTELKVEDGQDPRNLLLRKLVELLTKKEVKTLTYSELTETDFQPFQEPQAGAELIREELSLEASKLEFYAYGYVRTSGGEEIRFSLNVEILNLSVEIEKESVRSGSVALVDPLMIDLNGSTELLSPAYFEFDLDGDGSYERVPKPAEGKGFILFDRNRNGAPDAGEIVGGKSGSAFSELKELDEDGNRWIDEGDTTFGDLYLWIPGSAVLTLKEAGVSALFTGSVAELFELKDPSGELRAVVKDIGMYLREDRSAGTLFKVDFAV